MTDAPALSSSDLAQIRRRFDYLQKAHAEGGVLAGTGHTRIAIPKDKLTETDLGALGFVPVRVAIPEAGQDQFTSYRHPDNTYHLHSHPDFWTLHQDEHAAATMLARKEDTAHGKAKAYAQGAPHVLLEGLPGAYYYLRGLVGSGPTTAQRVVSEMAPELKARLKRLTPSRTFAQVLDMAKQSSPRGEYNGKPADPDSVKGKVVFQGVEVRLDRPKGFIMRGTDDKGTAWERTYQYDYGFIPKTLGGDADGLDVFIGPDKAADESYWCSQKKPDGSFDEYKVFLGFPSLADAKKAYTAHIPADRMGGWSAISVDMMKAMLGLEPEGVKKLAEDAAPSLLGLGLGLRKVLL